jgi:hypothetical protein
MANMVISASMSALLSPFADSYLDSIFHGSRRLTQAFMGG